MYSITQAAVNGQVKEAGGVAGCSGEGRSISCGIHFGFHGQSPLINQAANELISCNESPTLYQKINKSVFKDKALQENRFTKLTNWFYYL